MDMVAYMQGGMKYEMHEQLLMISRDRDHSEGRGVGVNCCLVPFRKFIRFGGQRDPSLGKVLQRGTSSIER